MKTFLWLLLGVGLIATYVYTNTPEFRGMVREKYPALAPMFQEPGSKSNSDGSVVTIKVNQDKLVGAWQAEDGSELLFFRADGKFRSALAAEFKVRSSSGFPECLPLRRHAGRFHCGGAWQYPHESSRPQWVPGPENPV
jgi:hypothetical protein